MADLGTPLDRITALEQNMAAINPILYGDERTRQISIFDKLDRIEASTAAIERQIASNNLALNKSFDARLNRIWLVVGANSVLILMVIIQLLWQGYLRR